MLFVLKYEQICYRRRLVEEKVEIMMSAFFRQQISLTNQRKLNTFPALKNIFIHPMRYFNGKNTTTIYDIYIYIYIWYIYIYDIIYHMVSKWYQNFNSMKWFCKFYIKLSYFCQRKSFLQISFNPGFKFGIQCPILLP